MNKEPIEVKFNCELQDEIICPHCGHSHSDSWEMAPSDDEGEVSCASCGKEFFLVVNREVTYTSSCKTGEHSYVKNDWHISDMVTCERCGDDQFVRFKKLATPQEGE